MDGVRAGRHQVYVYNVESHSYGCEESQASVL